MICSYKEHQNENPCYRGKWRSEYLSEVYGSEYSHYDFNASIWRLSYNLLHDEMLPESIDGYELAYGDKFESKEDRDLFKKIAMRLYFGGINQLGVQVENKFKEMANKLGENYVYDHERARCIQDIMSDQKLLAIEKIGGFFDSEIFLHESCIYLNIYKDIVDSGIRCIQIYDSFYFKSNSNINVNQLYKTHLNQYKLKFANTFNYLTLDDLSYHISNLYGGKKDMKIVKQDNSDIPTDKELLLEEYAKFKKLDKSWNFKLSKFFVLAERGNIDNNDLNRLLKELGFWVVRSKGCKQGFSPSSTSLIFKKFVNNTLAKTAARRKIKA